MKALLLALAASVIGTDPASAGTREDELLRAVRAGDVAAAKALLDQGVPVDAKFRYDRTPLSFAADRGQVEMAKLLLERGADVDARDTFYGMTPLAAAANKGNVEIVRLMLARHPAGAAQAVIGGLFADKAEIVDAAVATGKLGVRDLSYALQAAEKANKGAAAARLRAAGAVPPPAADAPVDPAVLARYAGRYRKEGAKDEMTLSVAEGALHASFGGRAFKLGAIDAHRFQNLEAVGVTFEVKMEGERVGEVLVAEIGSEDRYKPVPEEAKP